MAVSFRNKRLILLLLIVSLWGCDTEYFSPIPVASVNFKIYPLDLDREQLSIQNGSKVFTSPRTAGEYVGYGGLLVFRSSENGVDVYYAYDLSCPNEAKRDVRVSVESSLFARCPVCKSKYDIYSGTGGKLEGPSKYPLKRYNGVSITNSVVTIYN